MEPVVAGVSVFELNENVTNVALSLPAGSGGVLYTFVHFRNDGGTITPANDTWVPLEGTAGDGTHGVFRRVVTGDEAATQNFGWSGEGGNQKAVGWMARVLNDGGVEDSAVATGTGTSPGVTSEGPGRLLLCGHGGRSNFTPSWSIDQLVEMHSTGGSSSTHMHGTGAEDTVGVGATGTRSSGGGVNSAASFSVLIAPSEEDPGPEIEDMELQAMPDGHDKTDLAWINPTETDQVAVYRDDALIDTLGNTEAYQDSELEPETNYNYRVEAYDDTSEQIGLGEDSTTTGAAPDPQLNGDTIVSVESALFFIDTELLPFSVVSEIEDEGDQPATTATQADSTGPQPNSDLISSLVELREIVGGISEA